MIVRAVVLRLTVAAVLVLFWLAHVWALSFDVEWDITQLATAEYPPYGWQVDWSEGSVDNTLTISSIDWGAGGHAIGEPLPYYGDNGNLTDGLTFHPGSLFAQAFQPSPTEPLRFRVNLSENFTGIGYDDIMMSVDYGYPYSLCVDCNIFLHLGTGGESSWGFNGSPTQPRGLDGTLPAPVISNVAFAENPEPGTLVLMLTALLLLAWHAHIRRGLLFKQLM